MLRIALALCALALLFTHASEALPAFAQKEGVACATCHTNGSAPHLTKTGYLYRRAGYRFPWDLGKEEEKPKPFRLTDYLAVGTNLDYEYVRNMPPGATASTIQNNNFDAREIEIWPLVGAFTPNFSAFTEVDFTPSDGSVGVTHAELAYVTGDENLFFNFRGGLVAPQGYGASDQWIDDGNLPLFESLTPQYNQDTLATPLGAFQTPQLGAECGANYRDTHLTVGIYNGFNGANGTALAINAPPSGAPSDVKVQVDQFLGDFAVTAVWYRGFVSLLDPSGTLPWIDHYSQWRLYGTYSVIPATVDLLAGGAFATNEYVSAGSTTVAGNFHSRGVFLGVNYYVIPQLTLSARYDYFQYNLTQANPLQASGASVMVGVPLGNVIFVFHYNYTASDVTGKTNDLRAELRLLF